MQRQRVRVRVIERERERERDSKRQILKEFIITYLHIYMYRDSERKNEIERDRER